MDRTRYALDLAKQVFQVFWVEGHNRPREKRLKRAQVLEFFARVRPRGWRWRPAAVPTTGGGS